MLLCPVQKGFSSQFTRVLLLKKSLLITVSFWKLGRNQLIVRFASATRPNLESENPTIWGRKNEVATTVDMWLQGQIDFFTRPFVTFHFAANY